MQSKMCMHTLNAYEHTEMQEADIKFQVLEHVKCVYNVFRPSCYTTVSSRTYVPMTMMI